MKEKPKANNFSPRRKKVKDLFNNENIIQDKLEPKTEPYSLPENFYDVETIYKNKKLNKFKDEILAYLRERDYFQMEKLNSIKTQSDKNERNIET